MKQYRIQTFLNPNVIYRLQNQIHKAMAGKEVIEAVLSHTKMKAPSFAATIGVSYQRIYDIQREKTLKISNSVASAIIAAYPEFNKTWLLSGEGEMLKPASPSFFPEVSPVASRSNMVEEVYLETKNGIKYYELSDGRFRMRVPLVPYSAYARFIDETSSAVIMDREEWDEMEFIVPQIGHGSYFAFEIKGDSMDDDSKRSFSHGDFVLARELDKVHWKDGLRYNRYPYWIIVLDSTILCKQIVEQDFTTGDITLHSLNPSPEYRDFKVNPDNVYRIFNIIQKVSAPCI